MDEGSVAMSISDEEHDQIRELEDIKNFVDEQKAGGNQMFVSGWDDDTDGVEEDRNPPGDSDKQILWAAENGELDMVRRLVEKDPTVLRVRDKDGYTALHRASYNNHVSVVEYLLAAGADHSARTEDGWQPLHSACHWNNALCAVKLLESGADINASTAGGQTPLHLAASHGASKDTLELLLMHPLIEPHKLNNAGETPYEIAKRSGHYHTLFDIVDPSVTVLPVHS